MVAKKKTSFYHTRNKIMPNNKQAAELLGVDIEEIKRMDKEGAPIMAERLLLLWDKKNINAEGWEGWCFSRGALMHKKSRWQPENLINARREAERVSALEAEIYKLYSVRGLMKITKKLLLQKRSW
jgi:hypothetical protein